MIHYHKELAESGRWQSFTLAEQMANIGSDVHRSFVWYKRKNEKYFETAFDRALELFDMTLADMRWKGRRKEIGRSRELFCAIFFEPERFDDLEREITAMDDYFLQWGIYASIQNGR